MKNYFSHDSNARDDEKIIALRMKHGWEGYGLYWAIIEKLREATCYQLSINYNVIAYDLRADASMIKSIINDFGLFAFTDCGEYFYSESLLKRMEVKDAKSKQAREAVMERWRREKENVRDTDVLPPNNGSNTRKVKESKGKENILSTKVDCKTSGEVPPSSETGKDELSDKTDRIDYKFVLNLYNSICTSLPKIQKLTDARKRKIKCRIKEMTKQFPETHYEESLEIIFRKMEASNFMRGNSKNNWTATFDWLFSNDINWLKVFEGNYDNKPTTSLNVVPKTEAEQTAIQIAQEIASRHGG